MKHLTLLNLLSVAAMVIAPSTISCTKTDDGPSEDNTVKENQEEVTVPDEDKPEQGDILIVYFSRAGENWQVGNVPKGNTAVMGDYIQELTGADVFEIVPENAYPTSYNEMLSVAEKEIDIDARPAIKNKLENIDNYDIVFIGSGIWHGQPPMIMHTFYESYPSLKDKTLIPFGTHGGSGIGSITSLIRKYFPKAKMLEGLGINGSEVRDGQAKQKVSSWLEKIGIESKKQTNENTMNKDIESIRAWLDRWDKAMIAQDVEALDPMMVDDIVIRHITGATQTKEEWLDEVKSGSMRYYDIRLENLKIEVNDDKATASFTSVIEANIWGSHGTWKINSIMYLERTNSGWIRTND